METKVFLALMIASSLVTTIARAESKRVDVTETPAITEPAAITQTPATRNPTTITEQPAISDSQQSNIIEELNPFDPNIEERLHEIDKIYEAETGKSAHLPAFEPFDIFAPSCQRKSCDVWIDISKAAQKAFLYVGGFFEREFLVSTGKSPYRTPNFDKHPDGRIYDRYTSRRYPGGNYQGLGNMPYAVFIRGGFAIHGTPEGNWKNLGKPASHGCIRSHPENGKRFNRLVRSYGVRRTWITVR